MIVKGTPLAMLAYGDLGMKESWDIDLLTSTEAFDIVANYYSNVVADEDSRRRAAEEIRRDIVTQLTLFLQRRAAGAPPP